MFMLTHIHSVLSIATHASQGKTVVVIVAGLQDGTILLCRKRKLEDASWSTDRMFSMRINGPVSTLSLYAPPGMFAHYGADYEKEHTCEEESVSLLVGSASGFSGVYASVEHNAFDAAHRRLVDELMANSVDCCDSVLCACALALKGNVYLLCGCYSGKLRCYQQASSSSHPFALLFESQFDQQIHGIAQLPNHDDQARLAVVTLNKIYFVSLRMRSAALACQETRVVSL